MIKMRKLVLNQKCLDPLAFQHFGIDLNGNIGYFKRAGNIHTDRTKSNIYRFSKTSYVEYTDNHVKLRVGSKVYEEPLSTLFIRSHFGYNFNSLKDISGEVGIKTLLINGRGLEWPLKIRDNKLSTKCEQIFYDKWSSIITTEDLSKYHGKYYNKWCKSVLNRDYKESPNAKVYNDKFLFLYRAMLKRFNIARSGIASEVLVVTKDKYYFIDFFIPTLNMGIEIDGYHHYYDTETLLDDFVRSKDIFDSRDTLIYRLPNNDIESLTRDQLLDIIDKCYDRAGYLVTKSISGLRDRKFKKLSQIATRILNGQSASNLPNYSGKHVSAGIKKAVQRSSINIIL